NDGESFQAGDRTLYAVRPPIYDAPTTRGLFDSKTGVYWGSDCFAAPVLGPVEDSNDMEREFWRQGFTMFHSLVSPWHAITDPTKFKRDVDRISTLDIKVAVAAHNAPLHGERLDEAFELLRALPNTPAAQLPGQAEL